MLYDTTVYLQMEYRAVRKCIYFENGSCLEEVDCKLHCLGDEVLIYFF